MGLEMHGVYLLLAGVFGYLSILYPLADDCIRLGVVAVGWWVAKTNARTDLQTEAVCNVLYGLPREKAVRIYGIVLCLPLYGCGITFFTMSNITGLYIGMIDSRKMLHNSKRN